MAAVEAKYGKSEFEKRHYALLALSSLYGIELLADNIAECRANMLDVFADYLGLEAVDVTYLAASHILSLNLIHGDAMSMKDVTGGPITVVEWAYLGKGKFNRRDFRLDVLTGMAGFKEEKSLFANIGRHEIFQPKKTYPPMTIKQLAAFEGEGLRMTEDTPFRLKGRNPDVLSCIANLSNDEVFTPPEFANRMLDTLAEGWAAAHDGADIWTDSAVTYLDPCAKSGVFLREITKRLIKGLEPQIPDLQARVDHILTRQVFGIGITQLTALLARRSLYCSKFANGPHSVATAFDSEDGNVWFERTEHSWDKGGKCIYCGASQGTLDRGDDAESHAYAFIHTDNIKGRVAELFGADMQFDVIIGNPPYQLSDGGHGTSAAPIYHSFVDQAKALEPRYLSMVIPSRWFSGGKGLDEFRSSMLQDNRIRVLHDYLTASEVFPGVGLKGGVCYFLWDRDHEGDCRVETHFKDWDLQASTRPLLENGISTFVRFNEGLSILKKVMRVERANASPNLGLDRQFADIVSSRKPFGLDTTFLGRKSKRDNRDLKVLGSKGTGFISRDNISAGADLIDAWKVFVGRAAPGTGNQDSYPHKVISTPFVSEPGVISSETYLCIGPLGNEAQAQSVASYLSCKFTRVLVLLHKATQDTSKKVYQFVPMQTWDRIWTDEELYQKYGITEEEIAFIESIVRPMELDLFNQPADN